MKPSSTLRHAAVALVSLSAMASAWPSWLPQPNDLIARQDGSSSSSSQVSPSPTQPANTQKTTNLNTGATKGATVTNAPTGTTGKAASNSTTRTQFNSADAAGSLVMITPAPLAGTQLYKVGDAVSWAWNYTNLQGPPTAIDVLVSCSVATRTWTLTQNMTYTSRVDFVWDTNQYKNLVVEEYTLLVHDSDGPITGAAEPGYLAPFAGFTFGVYTPAPYTPLASGWQCVSCSGAASGIDRRAVGFALAMGTVTVLTFTWFVTGLGVLAF